MHICMHIILHSSDHINDLSLHMELYTATYDIHSLREV